MTDRYFRIRWGGNRHAIGGTEKEIRWFIQVNRDRDRPERTCVTSRKRADEIEIELERQLKEDA